MERRIYVLEKRKLWSDFCDKLMNLGFEKYRKEKDTHNGNNHTFECYVCEMKLKKKEHLDVLLHTCKIYVCSLCSYRHNRLSKLKSHCKTKHARNTNIRHSKMDRDYFTKFSFTTHLMREI